MRKLALALASFLASQALQMSGYQNPDLAALLLCVSGFLALWALVTWEPAMRFWRQKLVPRFVRPMPAAQEMGLIEVRRAIRQLHKAINPILLPIRQREERIANLSASYRPRIAALAHASNETEEDSLYRLVLREAKDVNKELDGIEALAAKLDHLADTTVRNFDGLARLARERAGDINLVTLRDSMSSLAVSMTASRGIEESFRGLMSKLHGWGTSELNASSTRGTQIAARMVASQDRIRDACLRVVDAAKESLREAPAANPPNA